MIRILLFFLILQSSLLLGQPTVFERCEALGRGTNLSFMEQYWNGSPSVDFQDYLNGENLDWLSEELQAMKNMDISSVRLPVSFDVWMNEEDQEINELYFSLLDHVIEKTLEYDLKLIIDFHHGSLIGEQLSLETNKLIQLWELIAKRYQHTDPEMIYFDLYNEAHDIEYFFFDRAMRKLAKALRKITPDHTFIVGGLQYNNLNGLYELQTIPDDNIIYAFHFYEPFVFTHQGTSWVGAPVATRGIPYPYDAERMPDLHYRAEDTWGERDWKNYAIDSKPMNLYAKLEKVKQWSNQNGIPVVCSEWGSYYLINEEDRCRYTSTMVDIFSELEMPNLFWDWNQNFSLRNPDSFEMADCMKAAWEPRPFFPKELTNSSAPFLVYPNPARDFLFINQSNWVENSSIEIFDATGRNYYAKERIENHLVIPIEHWQTGIYFLRSFSGEKEVAVTKFFID